MGLARSLLAAGLAGIAVGAGAAPTAMPATLHITAEHMPPASMREGDTIVGRETDKIREILRRSKITYQLDLLPWKRAYTLAQNQPDTCVYSTSRTPEREKLFKWVGPTDQADWIFYGRAEDPPALRTLEDARPLRIGTYHGDARHDYLVARGFHVDPAQNDLLNAEKLLKKRIDLWAVSVRKGVTPFAKYYWGRRVVPVLTFHTIQVYLACNPSVPDQLIERMNAAMAGMRRDGSIDKIERKYLDWPVSP